MLTFSKAGVEDYKNISTLAVQVWLDTYAKEGIRDVFSNYIWSSLTPEVFKEKFRDDKIVFYKAVGGDHLAGFAEIHLNAECPSDSGNKVEVEKFYLQENFCGKGSGKLFLEYLSIELKKMNIANIWLSVLESNTRAVSFYLKNGFRHVGEIYFELENERHKNLVMTKKLTDEI